jgi:ligand-binding SRPBCC domain-containing protein
MFLYLHWNITCEGRYKFKMNNFYHEFEVNSNIDNVWEFYTNIRHLEIVSPKDIKLNMIKSTDEILKKGTVACFSGKIVIGARWCSKITFFEKYHYVDEMIPMENIKPPFKIWKHEHTFKEIGCCKTRVIDKIEFELSYGILGKISEFYVGFILHKIFKHRKRATRKFLE